MIKCSSTYVELHLLIFSSGYAMVQPGKFVFCFLLHIVWQIGVTFTFLCRMCVPHSCLHTKKHNNLIVNEHAVKLKRKHIKYLVVWQDAKERCIPGSVNRGIDGKVCYSRGGEKQEKETFFTYLCAG